MSEKVLLLSVDNWQMTDEKTQQPLSGYSAWFVNSYREDSPTSFGSKPTKISVREDLLPELRKSKLPAFFDVDFGSRPGAAGKASLVLSSITFISALDLKDVEKIVDGKVVKQTWFK